MVGFSLCNKEMWNWNFHPLQDLLNAKGIKTEVINNRDTKLVDNRSWKSKHKALPAQMGYQEAAGTAWDPLSRLRESGETYWSQTRLVGREPE